MCVAVMFDIKQIFDLDILVSSNFFQFLSELEEMTILLFLPSVSEEIHFFRK